MPFDTAYAEHGMMPTSITLTLKNEGVGAGGLSIRRLTKKAANATNDAFSRLRAKFCHRTDYTLADLQDSLPVSADLNWSSGITDIRSTYEVHATTADLRLSLSVNANILTAPAGTESLSAKEALEELKSTIWP